MSFANSSSGTVGHHGVWLDSDERAETEAWRVDYNEVRPHSSLGNLTPKEYSTTVGLAWKVDQILGAGHNSEPFGKSICPLM